MTDFVWNKEHEEKLKELWDEGLSASKIGEFLGITKNSVIGKVHRLHLKNRVSALKIPSIINRDLILKKEELFKVSVVTDLNKCITSSKEYIYQKREFDKNKIKKITIMDLKEGMCRWPIGDPKEDDFCFCGKKTSFGQVYCNEHFKIAFTNDKHQCNLDY